MTDEKIEVNAKVLIDKLMADNQRLRRSLYEIIMEKHNDMHSNDFESMANAMHEIACSAYSQFLGSRARAL